MRISFAQSCKLHTFLLYTFFLVAIATIIMGVPLENALMTKRAEIQLTVPGCPTGYVYKASLCDEINRLMVFCENSQNPDDVQVVYNDCGPDETCIEHYHAVESDLDVPHATCIDNEHRVRKWDNFGEPAKETCSPERGYDIESTDMEIAVTIYANDGKPIQVNIIVAYKNGVEISTVYDQHNYTSVIRNYSDEKIKYCFTTGSDNKVTAYAAGWDIENKTFLLDSKN
ncbi:hypothetical protein RhiirA4_448491 [Rhizophagus irregularis]|uniref:Uncharacterized protein n=1 Tax=Rhizophagus irregularis TaxID=588596 RepID=A0A2I1HA64_9GLOM|nr:hypothetical protein RhiirA4_448491 [Rhizophagus irregularis]